MINVKLSFQVCKKTALTNSINFRQKVVKKFTYLYCLITKNAKQKREYDYLFLHPAKFFRFTQFQKFDKTRKLCENIAGQNLYL